MAITMPVGSSGAAPGLPLSSPARDCSPMTSRPLSFTNGKSTLSGLAKPAQLPMALGVVAQKVQVGGVVGLPSQLGGTP